MINIDDRLIEQLSDSELKLLLTFAKYGMSSHPDNDVLMYKTGFSVNKLQKNKNALIEKCMIEVKKRFKKIDGRIYRDSNQYNITTKLISKYNGQKSESDELLDFDVVQIELRNFEVLQFEVLQFEVLQFEVLQNEVGNKLLKSLNIKNSKLLEFIQSLKDENEMIKNDNEILRNEIESLKEQLKKEREKSSAKREKDPELFPDNSSPRVYVTHDKRSQKDKNELRPFSHNEETARLTLDSLFPLDNVELKKQYKFSHGVELTDAQIDHARNSYIQNLTLKDKLVMINHVAEFKRMFFHWWIKKDLKFQADFGSSISQKSRSSNKNSGVSQSYSKNQDQKYKTKYS